MIYSIYIIILPPSKRSDHIPLGLRRNKEIQTTTSSNVDGGF